MRVCETEYVSSLSFSRLPLHTSPMQREGEAQDVDRGEQGEEGMLDGHPEPRGGAVVSPPAAHIREEQRKRATLFVSRARSRAHREMGEIAEVLRQTVTTSLSGDAGTKKRSFLTNLSPETAANLFKFAADADLCRIKGSKRSATISFTCLHDLLSVLSCSADDFAQFGYGMLASLPSTLAQPFRSHTRSQFLLPHTTPTQSPCGALECEAAV